MDACELLLQRSELLKDLIHLVKLLLVIICRVLFVSQVAISHLIVDDGLLTFLQQALLGQNILHSSPFVVWVDQTYVLPLQKSCLRGLCTLFHKIRPHLLDQYLKMNCLLIQFAAEVPLLFQLVLLAVIQFLELLTLLVLCKQITVQSLNLVPEVLLGK